MYINNSSKILHIDLNNTLVGLQIRTVEEKHLNIQTHQLISIHEKIDKNKLCGPRGGGGGMYT